MSDKFKSILALALRPDTPIGEAEAAFAAARRMCVKTPFNDLLNVKTEVKTETKTKTIIKKEKEYVYSYSRIDPEYSYTITLTVPHTWSYSVLEHLFVESREMGVDVHVLTIKHQDSSASSGLEYKFKLLGSEKRVQSMLDRIDEYVEQIRESKKGSSVAKTGFITKKPGFWQKLKEFF